jgi:queuosine precursor transporter
VIAVPIYFAAIVMANLSIAHFGPWVSPINSFLLIGLDLSLRDHLHDRWQGAGLWPRMLGLIVGAGIVSYLLNPAAGQIAIASAVAFTAAGLVNAAVYHRLLRLPFLARANASNVPAAAADSLIFPTLAFGVLMPEIVALQFLAKVGGGAVWSVMINASRRQTA